MEGICIFEGCEKKKFCRGYCTGHYQQYARGQAIRPFERRWRRVERNEEGKMCAKCDGLKPLEEFHVSKASNDDRQPYCKVCQSEAVRTRRRKKREEKQDELRRTTESTSGSLSSV